MTVDPNHSDLCDTCPDPGHCCRVLSLAGGNIPPPEIETVDEAQVYLDGINWQELISGAHCNGWLPFHPLYQAGDAKHWRLWCHNLGSDGRCQDYANRPMCCRAYVPASDKLCVLHEGENNIAP